MDFQNAFWGYLKGNVCVAWLGSPVRFEKGKKDEQLSLEPISSGSCSCLLCFSAIIPDSVAHERWRHEFCWCPNSRGLHRGARGDPERALDPSAQSLFDP